MSGFHGFPDEEEEEEEESAEEDVDIEIAAADPETNMALPVLVDESPENEDVPSENSMFRQTDDIADTSCVSNL
jgi:hypothetical protein